MSNYRIRLYKDSDYKIVRDLFAQGILEHDHKAFRHGLSVPRNLLSMLLMFLVSLWISGSIIVSVIVLVPAISALWLCSYYLYSSYVNFSLSDDMLNIDMYYMQRDGYCFWVVESGGEVVGAVAAVPSPLSGGEKRTELKRMTIAKRFRGRGIAKVLCGTVIDFARQTGCVSVVLETSLPQVNAQKLYERMGFRKTRTVYPSSLACRSIDFAVLFYQYDIPTRK